MKDLMKNLSKAMNPEEDENAEKVEGEDEPRKVRFKKKFTRKKKKDSANDAARAALAAPPQKLGV